MKHVSLWRTGLGRLAIVLSVGVSIAAPVLADEPPAAAPSATSSAAPPAAAPSATSAPRPAPPPPAQPSAPLPAWEKIGDDDGIIAYRREVPGSPLIAVRGEGMVNASIVKVASVLVDSTRATEWIDRVVESRVVRVVSETETIHYDHIGTPVVMKDRDFVTRAKLLFDNANKRVTVKMNSTTDPLAPPTDYVRGEIMESYFILTSLDHGTKTHVQVEVHADPKGSIAKWIVNMFQKSWPHNTISRLRAQVAKPDIKEHARLKAELTSAGYLN
ncbi:MAG: START domain-containing protein [Polyangiaceae bacterium]